MTKQEEIALQNLMNGNLEISLKQIKNNHDNLLKSIILKQNPNELKQFAELMRDLYRAGAVDALKALSPEIEELTNDKIGNN